MPAPSADALAASERLSRVIAREIAAAQGWLPFDRYMDLALHAPGLGYYSAGARKFGPAGDFVTAPGLGALFARTLAREIARLVEAGLDTILELGAGDGALAHQLLSELARLDRMPREYLILETSADLKERQAALLHPARSSWTTRVGWLASLPARIDGIVLANEVLDAMPVRLVETGDGTVDELGVSGVHSFAWARRPADRALAAHVESLALPAGYRTEVHTSALGFVRTLGKRLTRGVALFIDYGFPAHEYYHPQRAQGTLMCHYRHHAHGDPFAVVGLQDITAHIDFTALAREAATTGLELYGYTSQAQFLVNCGLTEVLAATGAKNTGAYLPLAAQAQTLTSPAEMGELFKVIAFGKRMPDVGAGFRRGDRRHTLTL